MTVLQDEEVAALIIGGGGSVTTPPLIHSYKAAPGMTCLRKAWALSTVGWPVVSCADAPSAAVKANRPAATAVARLIAARADLG
jgi:hypothetical protein